jgi:hypothetical protein
MIGSTLSKTSNLISQNPSQGQEDKAKATIKASSKSSQTISQDESSQAHPKAQQAPTLVGTMHPGSTSGFTIPIIHVSLGSKEKTDSKADEKISKRQRFAASIKNKFHKSEGSLLANKGDSSKEKQNENQPSQPSLSKRERLSQIFTSDKDKAKTIYFEEGHPLLTPPSSAKKTDTQKPSKRERLSRALKGKKRCAEELYYADEPKRPLSKRSSTLNKENSKKTHRPVSLIATNNLLDPNRIYSPTTQRRKSFDSVLPVVKAPEKEITTDDTLEILKNAPSFNSLTKNQILERKYLEEAEEDNTANNPPKSPIPLFPRQSTGSFKDFLNAKQQASGTQDNNDTYFAFPDIQSLDPLLSQARAFKNNTSNYSIEASKTKVDSPREDNIPLNPCCKNILEALSAHIGKLSNNSIPNSLSSAPTLGQNTTLSAILPFSPLKISENSDSKPLRDSQLTKTDETVTVDLDRYKYDKRFGIQELGQLLQEFIKYSGLVGDLVALGKHTWVVTHTHASMSLYICPKRMGCRPSSFLSSIIESNRNNKGVMYKEVNSETLRNARKLSTPYTRAYAQSIRKNLHWKTTLAKFIGSCIAVSGIFIVLLSNAINEFNPNIAFGLYGYYLISMSICFFLITQFCKTAYTQCLSLRETKQMNLYRDLLKQSANTYLYGSIQNLTNTQNIQKENALKEQTLELINNNFDFTLRHILESLKAEQERPADAEALFPQVLADPNQYIHNPSGSTYIFLKATLGIKKHTLNLLLKEYKKDELKARRILHELLLDSKMLSS